MGVAVGIDPETKKWNASTSLDTSPQALPSKWRKAEYEQTVTLPTEVGAHTNTSSLAPETPLASYQPLGSLLSTKLLSVDK